MRASQKPDGSPQLPIGINIYEPITRRTALVDLKSMTLPGYAMSNLHFALHRQLALRPTSLPRLLQRRDCLATCPALAYPAAYANAP